MGLLESFHLVLGGLTSLELGVFTADLLFTTTLYIEKEFMAVLFRCHRRNISH